MKRFIFETAAFITIQILLLFAMRAALGPSSNSFLAATQDKEQRALTAAKPRILFIGGSNVAFGFDCAEIKKALQLEPINFGSQASLGLYYHLAHAKEFLQEGDTAVISIEYEGFNGDSPSIETMLGLLDSDQSQSRFFKKTFSLLAAVGDEGHYFLAGICKRFILEKLQKYKGHPIYRRDSFNQYGDVVAHRNLPSPIKISPTKLLYTVGQARNSWEQLNKFAEECAARNITVLISHPPRAFGGKSADDLRPFELLQSDLDQNCNVLQLNRITDMLYAPANFFDTIYHCNSPGIARRTQAFIDSYHAHVAPTKAGANPLDGSE